MSADILLSGDECSSIASYDGIFTTRSTGLTLVTHNSKKWFTRSGAGTDDSILPLPDTARKIVGIRFTYPTALDNTRLFQLLEADQEILRVTMQTNGSIRIGKGTEFDTATGLVQVGVEHYLEVDCPVVANQSSTVIARLDGVEVYNHSVPTGSFGRDSIDNFALWDSPDRNMRDLYVLSTSGAQPTTFLGPGFVQTIRPNGAGASNEWDHVNGDPGDANNYTEVDDADPDEDTTAVKTSVVDTQDFYALQDLDTETVSAVHAVVGFFRGKKDDAGARTVAIAMRSGVGDTSQGDAHGMAEDAYGWFWDDFATEPGGADWTPLKINAAQLGPVVTG